MTPDTTHDTTDGPAPDATHDSATTGPAYILTISAAADALGCSVRTVQRRLDAGELQPAQIAGKRCVRLTAADLPTGLVPDGAMIDGTPGGVGDGALSPNAARLARDVSRDTTLAQVPETPRALALVAAVVRETLAQAGAQAAARPSLADISCKPLLTLPECQQLTGLSRAVLRAAIDGGQLQAAQIGRAWRVKRAALEAYIERL